MLAGISIWQLLIVAVIIALLFGTKKLRSLGSDVGHSITNFKAALRDDSDSSTVDDESNKALEHTPLSSSDVNSPGRQAGAQSHPASGQQHRSDQTPDYRIPDRE